MLPIIAIILLICWAIGLAFHIAGGLIHIILILALLSFVIHILLGKKA